MKKYISLFLFLILALTAVTASAQSSITWGVPNGSTVEVSNHNGFSTIAGVYPSSGATITYLNNSNNPPANCSVYFSFPLGQGLAVAQCNGAAPGYYSLTLRAMDSAGAPGGTLTVTLHVNP